MLKPSLILLHDNQDLPFLLLVQTKNCRNNLTIISADYLSMNCMQNSRMVLEFAGIGVRGSKLSPRSRRFYLSSGFPEGSVPGYPCVARRCPYNGEVANFCDNNWKFLFTITCVPIFSPAQERRVRRRGGGARQPRRRHLPLGSKEFRVSQ